MVMQAFPFRSLVSVRPMYDSAESQDFEFDPLQPTTVILPPSAMDWAVGMCQQTADPTQQWPVFLRAMALQGVEHWLAAGASDLSLSYDQHRPPRPDIQAEVNGFRLCLVPQGSLSDGQVWIPQSTLDHRHHFAHLYVLVEVNEEANQVTILCGLRRDQLLAYQQHIGLTVSDGGDYILPVTWFDALPEDLLLYLTCLNPEQVVAPQAMAASPSPASPTRSLTPADNATGWINVGRWFQDQIDLIADTITWSLLPPLSVSHAMMSAHSPATTLEAVLGELAPSGVTIPDQARGAYTDLQSLGLPVRLYALAWPIMSTTPPEWSLFLVLGPLPGETLPLGIRLVVQDATTTLAENTLTSEVNAQHLYAQVFGTWDEHFTVSVHLPTGASVNWPPFGFNPEEVG